MKRKLKFNEQTNGGPNRDAANHNAVEPGAGRKNRILIVEDKVSLAPSPTIRISSCSTS